MTEKLFEAFDFIFVFAVTNHQVVVFFSNDQVIDALNDDIFSGRNVHNTVVRIVKHHFIRIGDIVVASNRGASCSTNTSKNSRGTDKERIHFNF